ncbi:MAG: WYL domain-containing protein [Pseudorhodobacter sp.]|nr:MAG: WYL domain-containing protein [Pseudorhodobacter sp.]
MGKRKNATPKGSMWQALDADQILRLATGLDRAEHDAMLGRRGLIRYLVTRDGLLHLTRAFSCALGLRRRALRAEIDRWLKEPGPHQGQIVWAGRNRLSGSSRATGPLILDLDGAHLALIFAALRQAQDSSLSTTQSEAYSALRSRLSFMLPPSLRQLVEVAAPPAAPGLEGDEPATLAPVLDAMRQWRRLRLRYEAASGAVSERTVWPIILHYRDACLVGWCELRNEFRSFRLDRMLDVDIQPDSPPRPRAAVLAEWRANQWQD